MITWIDISNATASKSAPLSPFRSTEAALPMERPSFVAALSVPSLRQQMIQVSRDNGDIDRTTEVLIERYTFMLRHGCEEDCAYCRIGNERPTVYAARAFAQQYILMNKRLCPRIARLYVPLVNFDRPRVAESLIMRVRYGKVPRAEAPVARPDIGIIVRPQHVAKHKPKVKEPIKEKPIVNAGSYRLRDLNMGAIERVIEITNDTKDDSFLRQIIQSLSDVDLLANSFRDPPKFRTHKNVITNQADVHFMFDELDRRHVPLLFDSLHRALLDIDSLATFKEQIHCLHLGWQALASIEDALEVGGLPLAITLVDLETQKENFKARFDAFSVFLSNYEMLCAQPVIQILQSLLILKWSGEVTVEGLRKKCLILLEGLHQRHSNRFHSAFFQNETIAKVALSDRHQRDFVRAFMYEGETLLDHPYLFSHSDKLALFEFWVVDNMELQHKRGWGLRRIARHFYNLGFRVDHPQSAYLGITVDRQDLLHDVTKAITGQLISVLHKPMKVKYAGEQGIDLAGLTADLLSRVIKACIARCLEMNLLRECNGIWFQEGADCPAELHRLGLLIGLAMYNGVKSLPLDFPPMFYKKLIGESLQLDDMKEFDPDLLRGWRMMMDLDLEDMVFEYTYQIGTEVRTHVMEYDGGQPKAVTTETRQQYIQSLFTATTDTLIAKSFNALRLGIESVIPRRLLRLFTSSQLQSLMAGERVVDVQKTIELLKQVTVYDGFSPDDPVIRNLWEILNTTTPNQFSQFFDLITASDRIPSSFPSNFKLTIFKSGTDEEMFPRGQTCMHGLGLPAYTSADKLREKLFTALESFAAPGGDAFHLD